MSNYDVVREAIRFAEDYGYREWETARNSLNSIRDGVARSQAQVQRLTEERDGLKRERDELLGQMYPNYDSGASLAPREEETDDDGHISREMLSKLHRSDGGQDD